jgi:hypothetical protein
MNQRFVDFRKSVAREARSLDPLAHRSSATVFWCESLVEDDDKDGLALLLFVTLADSKLLLRLGSILVGEESF